jgi:sulfite exporter TauE/SafE
MILDLLAPVIVGFAGSLHCLGMCGPLVVAYSLHIRSTQMDGRPCVSNLWSKGLTHHLAFHSGRILCYGLLGALASALGYMTNFSQFFASLRSSVILVGGLLMVFFGLVLLKVISVPLFSVPSFRPNGAVGRALPRLLASDRIASKWALGFAVGFLPCMLSWAMIVKAATTTSPVYGFMTMALFGLGTAPALFFTGLSASLFTLRMRIMGERVAACSVIAMGIILLVKGARYFA